MIWQLPTESQNERRLHRERRALGLHGDCARGFAEFAPARAHADSIDGADPGYQRGLRALNNVSFSAICSDLILTLRSDIAACRVLGSKLLAVCLWVLATFVEARMWTTR